MRKLIVIVLLGLVSWPITTMYAADIDLPDFGDSAGALISPLQEYQIGRSFFWRLQQSVDLVEDPEVNGYVQSVGYRLVANSDSPSLPFTFFVVPDPSINAFAAPGGFIGIHTGLILASETEDEMASVMAHEIAHVTQRHLVRSYEQSQQRSLPSTIAMIGAVLLAIANPEAGMAGLMAVQAGGVQSQINFTRSNEKEADNIGMLTLVHSGFDAQAMPAFFERLQKSSRFYTSDSVPEFLRTHPVTTNRIAEARGRAVTYPVKRQLSDTLQFYLIREKLRVMGSTDLAQLIQYYASSLESGNNVNQTATRYGYSLALSAIGDYFLARAVLQPLIDQDEDRLSYQLALADIEIGLGEMGNALAIYQESQKLYPDDRALTVNQVEALLLADMPGQASNLLFKQLEVGGPSRKLYKLLAQAKGDLGLKSQAHSWLAEYYYISGRFEQAADQLRLAAGFAAGDEYQLAKISSRLRDVEITLAQMKES